MSIKAIQKIALFSIVAGSATAISNTYNLSWAQVADTQEVSIQFQAMVGDKAFTCGSSYSNLGIAKSSVTPTDFRFYVSNIGLIDASGMVVPLQLEQDGKWQYQNVALLDFEDKSGSCANGTSETRTQVTGSVPAGDYKGITFMLGVPFNLNHNDATLAPSPLNLTSMWWNWQGGYKFVRIDLENQKMAANDGTQQHGDSHSQYDSHHKGQRHNDQGHDHQGHTQHGAIQGFLIHLGSTGCQMEGNSQQPKFCNHPNTSTFIFSEFNLAENVIVADLAALVSESNLERNEPDTPLGCMSALNDSDCTTIMNNFGIPYQGQPSSEQTFFRIE
ncbi:MAG: metallo-mystery pair system four-Cys motif protein [Symploca sp. SIO3C6]|uniref:Metallo-mystery pair system four-Cys motif protein n=1 Tax=Symploca sp. SIO1C4 TaxID=2607765 RepID=A0A6B3NMA1_9CYAN|nr:metallo-mystery pair system four-Cys motif protein [Symploca sp. SIO3C6]NER30338.1 metallo-mystery pair system four-Cys motif protein [Symploca sp. SIO1C4]